MLPYVRRALAVTLLTLAIVPAARAGTIVDSAAKALESDPVYVAPNAEKAISAAQERRLEREIRTKGHGPIYIAILPSAALDEAGGSATGIADELHRELGRRGVYAVVAGNQFRAEATDLDGGEAGDLAREAIDAHRPDGVAATLVDFVDRVGDARTGNGDGGSSGFGWWPILLVGGAGLLGYRTLRRRRTQNERLREVKETAREDLVALADDVAELEDDVERNPDAKRDYLAALEQYDEASRAFDRARSPRQLEPVAKALDEGRYLMTSAKARLEGSEPPERRPPCFFDPRHGPSVRDVEWSPDGGAPRQVPACAADAMRVEQGLEPEARRVQVGGQMVPYWSAPGYYGSYFGGFLPGLLIGEAIGGFGGFGGFGGWVGDTGSGDDSGGGDFGGDGDFGGGDFGGGDGGGGDF
ncbi:MAG TPA: hypothetical protein VGJ77_10110 [Gaiellaceae bacterium]